jgi:hypothetical protein
MKLLMLSRSFWVEFLGSLRYKIMSSVNRDSLTTSLPIYIPSCFIAVARNFRTILNGSGSVGTFVSFLTLGEMVSVFPH